MRGNDTDPWPVPGTNTMTSPIKPLAAFVVACVLAASSLAAAPPPPEHLTAPFVGGQGGYPAYRIPSLVVTKAGTLLAFAEGRANKSDHAENDVVLRRSG